MIPIENILKASAEELELKRQYLPDDQSENIAQEMFIKGAEWAVNFISSKPPVIKSVCRFHSCNAVALTGQLGCIEHNSLIVP